MLGMLITLCIRVLGPFFRHSFAHDSVHSESTKQYGVQFTETCVSGGS